MMRTSLPLENMYLELQELLQIPNRRRIFVQKINGGLQERGREKTFATMKCVKMHYYFKVFSIIFIYYIVINFLFKKIQSTFPKVDELYSPWKF